VFTVLINIHGENNIKLSSFYLLFSLSCRTCRRMMRRRRQLTPPFSFRGNDIVLRHIVRILLLIYISETVNSLAIW
jgi:hypothetical protein